MRQRLVLAVATVAIGVGIAATVTPAFAATTPTIAVSPAQATGFQEVTIAGHADAGATVTLYESAYLFKDLQPATNWDTGDTLTVTASSTGAYTIRRYVDSGFLFAVEAGGERSKTVTIKMKVVPTLTVSSTSTGTVRVHVAANPGQPYLPVAIQRLDGSVWTKVAGGSTTDPEATFDATVTGQGAGTIRSYRAVVGPDDDNGLIAGVSSTRTVKVYGTSTTPVPAVGSVQFTKIQYHGPTGLNNEWVRLTNKTAKTINLSGWTVRDAAGNTYTFTGSYLLGAARNVYVQTGKGTNGKPDVSHRYWGKTGYIWNNGGDTATLRAGTKSIDSCKWTSDKKVSYC